MMEVFGVCGGYYMEDQIVWAGYKNARIYWSLYVL